MHYTIALKESNKNIDTAVIRLKDWSFVKTGSLDIKEIIKFFRKHRKSGYVFGRKRGGYFLTFLKKNILLREKSL